MGKELGDSSHIFTLDTNVLSDLLWCKISCPNIKTGDRFIMKIKMKYNYGRKMRILVLAELLILILFFGMYILNTNSTIKYFAFLVTLFCLSWWLKYSAQASQKRLKNGAIASQKCPKLAETRLKFVSTAWDASQNDKRAAKFV